MIGLCRELWLLGLLYVIRGATRVLQLARPLFPLPTYRHCVLRLVVLAIGLDPTFLPGTTDDRLITVYGVEIHESAWRFMQDCWAAEVRR